MPQYWAKGSLHLSPSIRASSPLFKDDIFIEAAVSTPHLSPSIRASSPLFKDDIFIEAAVSDPLIPLFSENLKNV